MPSCACRCVTFFAEKSKKSATPAHPIMFIVIKNTRLKFASASIGIILLLVLHPTILRRVFSLISMKFKKKFKIIVGVISVLLINKLQSKQTLKTLFWMHPLWLVIA